MKCHLDAWPMFSGYVSFKEGKTFETLRKFMNYLSYKRASTALYFLSNLQHSINHLSMWLSVFVQLCFVYIFSLLNHGQFHQTSPGASGLHVLRGWSYSCCTAHVDLFGYWFFLKTGCISEFETNLPMIVCETPRNNCLSWSISMDIHGYSMYLCIHDPKVGHVGRSSEASPTNGVFYLLLFHSWDPHTRYVATNGYRGWHYQSNRSAEAKIGIWERTCSARHVAWATCSENTQPKPNSDYSEWFAFIFIILGEHQ